MAVFRALEFLIKLCTKNIFGITDARNLHARTNGEQYKRRRPRKMPMNLKQSPHEPKSKDDMH